ncbi:hypothetical protein DL93DRAFT_2154628 [Clavulina sp. PMI_390]|nr:hypothetical protein DL93DRAFT_2154628 [Clavulina sp. PMI_390]
MDDDSGAQNTDTHHKDVINDILRSRDWSENLGELCELIVTTRVKLYEDARALARSSSDGSLFEFTVGRLVSSVETGDDADLHALLELPQPVLHRLWHSPLLSYAAFRKLNTFLHRYSDLLQYSFLTTDVDEWILHNERRLRETSVVALDWQKCLVDWYLFTPILLSPQKSPLNLPSEAFMSILREDSAFVSGYTFLDQRRPKRIELQPSFEAFQSSFSKISCGMLEGLDWSHIFVAGGSVLSSLLHLKEWEIKKHVAADLDLYIYGLDIFEANRKLEHVFEVWTQNLPDYARETTRVLRNSRTITFLAKYPVKRVQVVLMLVKSPLEVLLNFDLDICCMGYDGKKVLMLPKAARALETGYNVLNMDWIHGDWLARRKPSIPNRVFKYADKGFGVRVIPVHLDASGLSVDILRTIAERAAEWTRKKLSTRCHGFDDDTFFSSWFCDNPANIRGSLVWKHGLRIGFEAVMRHVELWKASLEGELEISDQSPGPRLEDSDQQAYDEMTSLYTWGDSFDPTELDSALVNANLSAQSEFASNIHCVKNWRGQTATTTEEFHAMRAQFLEQAGPTVRVSWAKNVSDALTSDGNLQIKLFTPLGFADFANDQIAQARHQAARGVPQALEPLEKLATIELWDRYNNGYPPYASEDGEFDIIRWNIDSFLTWQQSDERVDQVHSVLWALFHSHLSMKYMKSWRAKLFMDQISRRSIRRTSEDDAAAFARWIRRAPTAPEGWILEST